MDSSPINLIIFQMYLYVFVTQTCSYEFCSYIVLKRSSSCLSLSSDHFMRYVPI